MMPVRGHGSSCKVGSPAVTSGPGSRGEGAPLSRSAASSGADSPEVGNRGPRSEEGCLSRSARGLSQALVSESYLALPPELQKELRQKRMGRALRTPRPGEALLCPGPRPRRSFQPAPVTPTGALTLTRTLAFLTSPPRALGRPTSEGGVARLTRTGPRSDLQQRSHQPGAAVRRGTFSVESKACLFPCG